MKNTKISRNLYNTSSGKSRTVIIVALLVILAFGAAGYAYAKSNKIGPFSGGGGILASKGPIEFKRLEQKRENLYIDLTKNTNEDGSCKVVVQSKRAQFTLDDTKIKSNANTAKNFVACEGWTIGTKTLPEGDYNVTITFKGSSTDYSTSKKITLN